MWVGWFLARGRWRRVCQAEDLGECHRQLLAATPPDAGRRRRLTRGGVPVGNSCHGGTSFTTNIRSDIGCEPAGDVFGG